MSKVQASLRSFLEAPKPEWCIPVDVIVMAQLILSDGKDATPEVLGPRCGVKDSKAVNRSLHRLRAASWIIKGAPGTYIVLSEKLPT